MKKMSVIIVITLAIGLGAGWLLFHEQAFQSGTSESAEVSGNTFSKKIVYYVDPMHPWYTSDKPGKAPDCGMDLVPVYEGNTGQKGIKIDPVTIQNIGVQTEKAEIRHLNKSIRTSGKIDYDETKVYTVNSKIMGWIEKLHVDYTGQRVRKGDSLLEIYSPELVTTQQEYLQVKKYREQLDSSSSEQAKKGAEDLVQSARHRLLYWDISENEIAALEKQGSPRKTMSIISTVDGVVIDKMVWQGQNVMAGMTMYKIADLSTVWILADIYQYELPWIKTGQVAEIELSYLPGKPFKGTVTYIYPYLMGETKTVRIRIQLRNTSQFELKPEMYVTVNLISPLVIKTVAVPEQAIIRSGERNIAVISSGGGYFDPRDVKTGMTVDGYTQILEGIRPGEEIVISSQFLIDSESNLRAAINAMKVPAGRDTSGSIGKSGIPENKPVIEKKDGELKSGSSIQAADNVYTCVMHPEIKSDKPGDCPKCGMKLEVLPQKSDQHNH